MATDKSHKSALVIDMAIPSDNNFKKKEYENLEKYQGFEGETRDDGSEGQSSSSDNWSTGSCDS